MDDLSKRVANLPSDKLRLLLNRNQKKRGEAAPQRITHLSHRDTNTFPLSYAQEQLWFLVQLEPSNPFYNMAVAVRVQGRLEPWALEQSLNVLVERHESLRTSIVSQQGSPRQCIDLAQPVAVPVLDLGGLEHEERSEIARQLTGQERARPFELSQGPLWRARLLRLGQDEHLLLLTLHHIIADGWSLQVLTHELTHLYTAAVRRQAALLPALPIQYADYARWQRQWLRDDVLHQQLSYWRTWLRDAPALLELPTDYPRPAVQRFRAPAAPSP